MWGPLIKLILDIVGPFIARWLEELFNKANTTLKSYPDNTARAVRELFAATYAKTGWFEWRKQRFLKKCESMFVARAQQMDQKMAGIGTVAPLSEVELGELAAAAGL